jgi:hypothetical protein
VTTLPPRLLPARLLLPAGRLPPPLVATAFAALLASLCVVSAAVSTSAVSRHHHDDVSVVHAGGTVRVVPSRKEY